LDVDISHRDSTGFLWWVILFLPLQAGKTGFGEEADLAFEVVYRPLLGGVVELDPAGRLISNRPISGNGNA
jgi:hypothetical protein